MASKKKLISFKVDRKEELELLEFLEQQSSLIGSSAYIKQLLKKELEEIKKGVNTDN